MTLHEVLSEFRQAPLVASVQASEGSGLGDVETLAKLARCSLAQGVRWLRLEGVESIKSVGALAQNRVIGLVKKRYPNSEVYIAPTDVEIDRLIETGCPVIALDGTSRSRPASDLGSLIARIKTANRLALADCDSIDSMEYSLACGADLVSTTLAGYTGIPASKGPDLEFLRTACGRFPGIVIAEGRFYEPWQARTALRIGARAVVVGGALNDPLKQTHRFQAVTQAPERVGAVDIGGSWLRMGIVDRELSITNFVRVPLPLVRDERLKLIEGFVERHGLGSIGIGTGGTVDPKTRTVIEANSLIPDYVGTNFDGVAESVWALNDGLATAWGHACHPQFAGQRVATLSLGTGVGFGVVDGGKVIMGRQGQYPRMNDSPFGESTIEAALGGKRLGLNPSADAQEMANHAVQIAVGQIANLFLPDEIVVAGSVGLQPWLRHGCQISPFGEHAGLIGAACLALFPPES